MSNMYYQKVDGVYKDLYDLCETKVYDAAPWNTSFSGDTVRQKAGSNTENVTMSNFLVDNSAITAVKRGYFPTFGKRIWYSTTPGSYSFSRTDSAMTIGSSSYSTSDFRCSTIPKEIIIVAVGGGGGGGGNGYWSPGKDKSGYARICSGAGGGGGCAVARVKLSSISSFTIQVGKGGAAGTNGASNDNTKGNSGGGGEASFAMTSGYTVIVGGTGGKGGTGGDGTGSKAEKLVPGTGGAGGSGEYSTTYCRNGNTCSGGKGNYLYSHTNTTCNGMSFTPTAGTGCPSTTVVSAKTNDGTSTTYFPDGSYVTVYCNKDDQSGDTSYFSGGCSYADGSYPIPTDKSGSAMYMTATPGGGGGGGGSMRCAGGPGYVAIYY